MKCGATINIAKFSDALEHLYEPVVIEKFPQRLFSVVSLLMSEVLMSFDEVNRSTGELRHTRNFEPPNSAEWLQRLAVNLEKDHPGMAYLRKGGSERVLQLTDFLTQRQLRETALYRENYLGPGIEYQIAVVIPIPGYMAGLAVNRGGKFADAEAEALRLLCPHFAQAHANARLFRKGGCLEPYQISKVAELVGLSAREGEVLYWVAQGKRNSEISPILNIGTRTVGKHVERILSKLRVETRTSAVTEALRLSESPGRRPQQQDVRRGTWGL